MTKEELLKVAKPILFNTEMVKAILGGRKTVTRRIVKPANPFNAREYRQGDGLWIEGYNKDDEPNGHIKDYSVSSCWFTKKHYIELYAPYKVGDVLYVRETWNWYNDKINEKQYIYRANYGEEHKHGSWKPSIHMPKEAARIFLRVTDVRVERLQDITEEQAWKEGILSECAKCKSFNSIECQDCANEHEAYYDFMNLWDSTIKKDHLKYYGCEANPYVWVIEFERVKL